MVHDAAQRQQDERVELLEDLSTAGPKKTAREFSRLYRSHILQVNMRLKALAEIYTIHSFSLL